MKKNIQEELIAIIKIALRDIGIDSELAQGIYLDLPANERFGDLSINCALKLGSLLKRPVFELAQNIIEAIKIRLEKSVLKNYVKEIKVEGPGFINFYLENKYFYEQLQAILFKGVNALKTDFGKGEAVLIEFVSANPTGSLSVAHARQAAVGDSLANILAFLGFKAKKEYYLNDEGNQIEILGKSVELRLGELNGEKIEFPENYYQGDYIYDIAQKIKNEKLEIKNLKDFAAEYILDIIKKELDDFGVKFDYWYSQKALNRSDKIKKALERLRKKKFLYELEGASWFKSTAFRDDKDRVVIKSDGSYTYLAPDIAYHEEKYRRGFKRLINLWGPDHHGYIPRIKAAAEAFGHNRDSLSVIIVQLATIFKEGRPLQMSTRKGQYITLREVLTEVGKDASRFFFLMRRVSSHLDFDLELAKKHTSENPVYYVQYAYARICSILRSSPVKIKKREIDFNILKEAQEIRLIKKLLQFPCILNICLSTKDPYMLTVFLQEVAEGFHKFYDLHRVLGDNEYLTQARLGLIEAARQILGVGFDLLGISKPEKM
ncbi:MAG: arginine--tRNA ligase [Candidatus Omnitrophota bacterium]|nr:arginine--tRNA ligase [Candidatus Omnitrophota bacterium]